MSTGKKPKAKKKPQASNNVIKFPTKFETTITLEQIQANKQAIHEIHIDETLDVTIPLLFENIDMMGIRLSRRPELAKDMNLVIDSIESLLKKYYYMEHPLQSVADQIFVLEEKAPVEDDPD